MDNIKTYKRCGNVAKKIVNDECYTDVNDIYKELSQWAKLGKFKNKNIICPCDWFISEYSYVYSFTITFDEYFKKYVKVTTNSVKTIDNNPYCDLWETNVLSSVEQLFPIDLFKQSLNENPTCNFIKVLFENAREWGIKSITASGYNPKYGDGIPFQNVDYSQYDICITNPPFSLYKQFMLSVVDKIDFITIAPFLSRGVGLTGQYLMQKKIFLGFGVEEHMLFDNPTYNSSKRVNCDWLTSFSDAQTERNNKHFKTGVKYADNSYLIMPNMIMKSGNCPIRVGMSSYPDDYNDWMFGTIGILDKLDQSVYEYYISDCASFYNENPDFSPFRDKIKTLSVHLIENGQNSFNGIIFRKKV